MITADFTKPPLVSECLFLFKEREEGGERLERCQCCCSLEYQKKQLAVRPLPIMKNIGIAFECTKYTVSELKVKYMGRKGKNWCDPKNTLRPSPRFKFQPELVKCNTAVKDLQICAITLYATGVTFWMHGCYLIAFQLGWSTQDDIIIGYWCCS